MWTILTWLLVPYLGSKYGVNGASIGYAVVGISSVVAIIIAKRYVNFSLLDSTFKPLFALIRMAAVLLTLRHFIHPRSAFILVAVGGLCIYLQFLHSFFTN